MKKNAWRMTVLLTAMCLAATSALAMPSYDDVLLVVNTQSPESQQIGAYFKAARNIPDANVCNISVTPVLGTGGRMGNTEKWAALAVIKNHLIKNKLTDKINYIVLTHGIPKYAYTGKKGPNYNGDEIDLYHLFDVFVMYQLSNAASDLKLDSIFNNNPYFYYKTGHDTLNLTLSSDAAAGQNYVYFTDASLLKPNDLVILHNGTNTETYTVAGVEANKVTFTNNLTSSYLIKDSFVKSLSSREKLNKKFSKTKFGYYIVGRLDGLGTATIKSMIDNTGYPATQSYKQPAAGKMKLLTDKPSFNQTTIDEIYKRGNIDIVAPSPVPKDVWNPVTQITALVENTNSAITLDTTFDKVGKDAMFCFLNDVNGSTGGYAGWPTENDYYAHGDFVQDYPFIYRGATFLPGSIMMVYRSNPAAYDSHGTAGGVWKMNTITKAKSSFVKLDASDMKFRHMTSVEYDPVNNQLWCGTGKNQSDVSMSFDQRCTDDAHRETMRNYGGGIAIYDSAGNLVQYINANDAGSPLKNNRVVKLVYDKNSKYMWVAHYKGIQYYDFQAKSWNDIPELQCDYAAASGIYPDPFDSDKVYFSFYYGTDTNTKKVSSQIPGADTSIFEYSKSAKTVTPYVIDASENKGVLPQMGKTSANMLWVSKGNVLYRYDLSAKSMVEKIDMSTVIPEKVSPPATSTKVTLDFIRNMIAVPSAKTVIATVGCNIQYSTDLIAGTPSTCQKKNYVVRVTENATPASTVETVNTSAMNAVNSAMPDFKVRDLAVDPADGKTVYMAMSQPGTVLRSSDGVGKTWSAFSTDYSAFNEVNGIALDGKGNIYAADGYFVGQNIVADFQAFGMCAQGGGMVHDAMKYIDSQPYAYTPNLGPYASDAGSWNYRIHSNGRGVSQVEPMMFMLLDGFCMGEARLAVFKCYPAMGDGGHNGHMTVFEPKCAPFAPRVNEAMIPANPQVIDKSRIEIPILSPGLPWHMNDVIISTANKDTIKITDDTGAVITPTGYSFEKPSGPDPAVDGKSFVTGTGKLVISGNFDTGIIYTVKLICGINGLKNIKGASLTNTRPKEFKDDITFRFGNGFDVSKGTYEAPLPASGPVKMPVANTKCDLIVNKVWLDGTPVAKQPLTVRFQIKNIGTAKTNAAPLTANVYWNNILVASADHNDLNAIGVADKKTSITDTAELSVVIDKQYVIAGRKNVIMVKADGTDKLAEIRESNNTNSTTFFIDNRPDLLVKEITLSSTKPGKTTVNFKICNTGFGPTAAGAGAQTAAVYVNNVPAGTVSYDDLAKGAVVSLQLANVNVTAGTCKIKVVADSTGIVTEVNKTNNSLEKPFIIK